MHRLARSWWLAVVAAMVFVPSRSRAQELAILDDFVDAADTRTVAVAVAAEGCAADRLVTQAAVRAEPLGPCVVRLSGPREASFDVTLAGSLWPIPPRPAAIAPTPSGPSEHGIVVQLVPAAEPLRALRVMPAAYVLATIDGAPTSELDLHVASERGRPRSLVWLAPGVAVVHLLTPVGTRSVDLTVSASGVPEQHVELPVADVTLIGAHTTWPEHVVRGEPFVIEAAAFDELGARAAPDRLRVRGDGCTPVTAALPATLVCDGARATLAILVSMPAGAAVLDAASFEVSPPAPPTSAPRALVAARAAIDGWQWPGAGARIAALVPLLGPLALETGVGWTSMGGSVAGLSPVDASASLVQHAVDARMGAMLRYPESGPWAFVGAVALGIAYERVDGHVGTQSTSGDGVSLFGTASAGARLAIDGVGVALALGTRLLGDVIAPGWSRALDQWFLEVSVDAVP